MIGGNSITVTTWRKQAGKRVQKRCESIRKAQTRRHERKYKKSKRYECHGIIVQCPKATCENMFEKAVAKGTRIMQDWEGFMNRGL